MLIPFDQLFERHKINVPGVLHLGANKGQEADAYLKQKIRRVIWVEALPQVFLELDEKVSKYPGSTALLACVSDVDGAKVAFHVANNEGQSSSLLEFGTHAQEHPTVRFNGEIEMETVRIDTLLRENGIAAELTGGWFLNVDLQGAELMALRGMGDLLNAFSYVYIEVNERELYKGCPLVSEIDAHLAGFGLQGVETKMTRHGWGDKLYSRK